MRRGAGRGRGGRKPAAEFRQLIERAMQARNLSDILGRHTKLKNRGRSEKVGLCPFHTERTPSFEVNDAKGKYFCHGCGEFGDHFKALAKLDGMTFAEAYTALCNDTFPTVSEEERARQREEDKEARRASIADAQALWDAGVAPRGTLAETYLRGTRGIVIDFPATIRFGRVPTSRDPDTGRWRRPYPAVMCACTDAADNLVGLQRIFLSDDGKEKRWGKRSKFSIGRPKSAAFKLGPPAPEIIMCEGPEDGLSLAQELPGRSVWVALGTAMMPEVRLPTIVNSVVIAGQNDDAGRKAVARAELALLERGLSVRPIFPDPAFKDWNDQLRGIRA